MYLLKTIRAVLDNKFRYLLTHCLGNDNCLEGSLLLKRHQLLGITLVIGLVPEILDAIDVIVAVCK